MKHDSHILICGDLCSTQDTVKLFESGNAQGLFKGLLEPFSQANLLIGNLEFPLTDVGQGIVKCGPVLKGKKACINVLKTAGFNVFGLANNHIRDCGDEGVLSTLECCRTSGIMTVGAGEDAAAARKPLVVDVAGWKIGIMAFAEHEFNAAAEDRSGANLFDVYYSFDEIRQLRMQCDYLVILYHGGIEHYAYPSPMLQKKCRKMVESGADLVLCQHSHCVGTSESYNDGTIVYGQGNTVFGYRPNFPEWNEGVLVKVSFSENINKKANLEFIPIVAYSSGGVGCMPSGKANSFLEDFFNRSQKVADNEFLNKSWQVFCEHRQALYLPMLFGLGRVLNYANRKLNNWIIDHLYSKKRMRVVMNLIRCEAHHEVVQTMLEQRLDG